MTDLQEKAMRMALERLESHEYWMDEEAIEALRQALAQPEQEGMKIDASAPLVVHPHPAFAAPPNREWVGLTDEEIGCLWHNSPPNSHEYARAIEAKLKEKNT